MKAHRKVLSMFAMALAIALAFFIVPAITDSGQKASAHWPYTLIYYDGHMHTTRSDGSGEVSDIVATAKARGLSAVIITDHCNQVSLEEWNSLVAETAAASDGSFLALPGVEITGSEGMLNRDHMNAWNISDPFVGDDTLELCPEEVWESPENPYGTGGDDASMTAWAEYVHAQGGIINHNHTTGHTKLEYGVDNVEIYNQGHVDDIMGYALQLGLDPADAWGLAITINNFAIYGERDLMMDVEFPGIPFEIPLRYALYLATEAFSGVGQIVGWSDPPNPMLPGDLNSWDELLMAYVNGEVDEPTFGVANSDAHNTKWTVDPLESNVGLAKNGLYVTGLTPWQVYNAIEAGRSFATTGPSLDFDVNGRPMGSTAYITAGGSANLNLSVNSESPTAILGQIDIVKNGTVVQTIAPLAPTYDGTLVESMTERGYYRVEVTSVDLATGAYQFAWSNPVFVKCPFDYDCDGYINLVERILGSDPDDSESTPEHWLIRGTCRDGSDNDGDGLIDRDDSGCPW
jgi:hypothetical protein